jgi:hypothetical protein
MASLSPRFRRSEACESGCKRKAAGQRPVEMIFISAGQRRSVVDRLHRISRLFRVIAYAALMVIGVWQLTSGTLAGAMLLAGLALLVLAGRESS